MTQALELREQPSIVTLSSEQLNFISRTEFVSASLRGNLPAILACVATGRAIGIPDMTALQMINVIDGKASLSAELMTLLVRKQGHSITGSVDDSKATVTGKRVDNNDEMTVTWTISMAERAGLLGKSNWKKYPEAMLYARAVSQLCRMLFADCLAGASYTPEELGVGDISMDEQQDDEPVRLPDVLQAENHDGYGYLASESQVKLVLARAREAGLDDDARHALMLKTIGCESTKSMLVEEVDRVLSAIAALDTRGVAESGEESSSSPAPDSAPLTRGVSLLGSAVIPDGVHAGETLHEVAMTESGIGWLAKRLKMLKPDDEFRQPLEMYVESVQPTLWEGYQRWREEQA